MGTYVSLKLSVLSVFCFDNLYKKIKPPIEPNYSDYHCTLMYSNQEIDYNQFLNFIGIQNVIGKIKHIEQVDDGSVVGWLDSPEINMLHIKAKQLLRWDSEFDYNPHITLFVSEQDQTEWCNTANEILSSMNMFINFSGIQINKLKV